MRRRQSGARAEMLEVLILLLIVDSVIRYMEMAGIIHDEDYYDQNQGYQTHVHTFGFDTWWKKLLLILGIIGIIVLVVSIVGGIISLLAPILIPLVIIMLIIRLIGGSGRRW